MTSGFCTDWKVALGGLALLIGRGAWAAEGPLGTAELTTLSNGMRVAVVQLPTPDVVAAATWVSVGSGSEAEDGHTGFAHFFEHLMFKDTPTRSSAERTQQIMRMGAQENAWTWLDETVYHAQMSTSQLPNYLAMEADRFMNLALTDADVRREAGAVYGEFRKSDARPGTHVSNALWTLAFPGEGYGHSTLGFEADIAAMPESLDHATAFFEEHYQPKNATLVLAGDVDLAAVLPEIERTYGAWEAPAPRAAGEQEETASALEESEPLHREALTWPTDTAPRLALGWRTDPLNPDDPQTTHLRAAVDWLAAETGPLQRTLVQEEGLAYSVGLYNPDLVQSGFVQLYIQAKPETNLKELEAKVKDLIEESATSLTDKELGKVATATRYEMLVSLDAPTEVVNVVGHTLRRATTLDRVSKLDDAYRTTTAAEARAAIQAQLVEAQPVVVTLQSEVTP